MERLTKEDPMGNYSRALNLFYIKDRETWVRRGGDAPDYPDISLNDWMRKIIKKFEFMLYLSPELDDTELSEQMTEALLDGTDSHEGLLATLYTAAWAFSALREKLKRYEDTGYEPQEIRSLESEWNAMRSVVESYRYAEARGKHANKNKFE